MGGSQKGKPERDNLPAMKKGPGRPRKYPKDAKAVRKPSPKSAKAPAAKAVFETASGKGDGNTLIIQGDNRTSNDPLPLRTLRSGTVRRGPPGATRPVTAAFNSSLLASQEGSLTTTASLARQKAVNLINGLTLPDDGTTDPATANPSPQQTLHPLTDEVVVQQPWQNTAPVPVTVRISSPAKSNFSSCHTNGAPPSTVMNPSLGTRLDPPGDNTKNLHRPKQGSPPTHGSQAARLDASHTAHDTIRHGQRIPGTNRTLTIEHTGPTNPFTDSTGADCNPLGSVRRDSAGSELIVSDQEGVLADHFGSSMDSISEQAMIHEQVGGTPVIGCHGGATGESSTGSVCELGSNDSCFMDDQMMDQEGIDDISNVLGGHEEESRYDDFYLPMDEYETTFATNNGSSYENEAGIEGGIEGDTFNPLLLAHSETQLYEDLLPPSTLNHTAPVTSAPAAPAVPGVGTEPDDGQFEVTQDSSFIDSTNGQPTVALDGIETGVSVVGQVTNDETSGHGTADDLGGSAADPDIWGPETNNTSQTQDCDFSVGDQTGGVTTTCGTTSQGPGFNSPEEASDHHHEHESGPVANSSWSQPSQPGTHPDPTPDGSTDDLLNCLSSLDEACDQLNAASNQVTPAASSPDAVTGAFMDNGQPVNMIVATNTLSTFVQKATVACNPAEFKKHTERLWLAVDKVNEIAAKTPPEAIPDECRYAVRQYSACAETCDAVIGGAVNQDTLTVFSSGLIFGQAMRDDETRQPKDRAHHLLVTAKRWESVASILIREILDQVPVSAMTMTNMLLTELTKAAKAYKEQASEIVLVLSAAVQQKKAAVAAEQKRVLAFNALQPGGMVSSLRGTAQLKSALSVQRGTEVKEKKTVRFSHDDPVSTTSHAKVDISLPGYKRSQPRPLAADMPRPHTRHAHNVTGLVSNPHKAGQELARQTQTDLRMRFVNASMSNAKFPPLDREHGNSKSLSRDQISSSRGDPRISLTLSRGDPRRLPMNEDLANPNHNRVDRGGDLTRTKGEQASLPVSARRKRVSEDSEDDPLNPASYMGGKRQCIRDRERANFFQTSPTGNAASSQYRPITNSNSVSRSGVTARGNLWPNSANSAGCNGSGGSEPDPLDKYRKKFAKYEVTRAEEEKLARTLQFTCKNHKNPAKIQELRERILDAVLQASNSRRWLGEPILEFGAYLDSVLRLEMGSDSHKLCGYNMQVIAMACIQLDPTSPLDMDRVVVRKNGNELSATKELIELLSADSSAVFHLESPWIRKEVTTLIRMVMSSRHSDLTLWRTKGKETIKYWEKVKDLKSSKRELLLSVSKVMLNGLALVFKDTKTVVEGIKDKFDRDVTYFHAAGEIPAGMKVDLLLFAVAKSAVECLHLESNPSEKKLDVFLRKAVKYCKNWCAESGENSSFAPATEPTEKTIPTLSSKSSLSTLLRRAADSDSGSEEDVKFRTDTQVPRDKGAGAPPSHLKMGEARKRLLAIEGITEPMLCNFRCTDPGACGFAVNGKCKWGFGDHEPTKGKRRAFAVNSNVTSKKVKTYVKRLRALKTLRE